MRLIKICKIEPPDLLILVVFIRFYISRYHFSQIFRNWFCIIRKKDFRHKFSSQKFLVLILSTSEGWKAESTSWAKSQFTHWRGHAIKPATPEHRMMEHLNMEHPLNNGTMSKQGTPPEQRNTAGTIETPQNSGAQR